jgi:uncharacterized protein YtpQ (UPF0354 family)
MRTRVLLVCLTSVPLLAWAPSVLADGFTEKVATAFRKNAPDLKLAIREDNELQVEGSTGPLTLYLDNIRASCASDPQNCDTELESFVERAAFIARSDKEGRAFVPEKVFVVLRSAGFGKRAGEQFASDEKKQPVVRPFVTGIELLYVIDTPKAFRFVNRADLDVAGLSVERLHEIATRNVRALRPPEYGPAPNAPDILFMPADDGLGTSRVLDSALWDRIEKAVGGAVVVCAPTRDWILFVRRENRDAIERLRDLAKRIVRGEAYPVSPVLFYRQNGSWQAYAG